MDKGTHLHPAGLCCSQIDIFGSLTLGWVQHEDTEAREACRTDLRDLFSVFPLTALCCIPSPCIHSLDLKCDVFISVSLLSCLFRLYEHHRGSLGPLR